MSRIRRLPASISPFVIAQLSSVWPDLVRSVRGRSSAVSQRAQRFRRLRVQRNAGHGSLTLCSEIFGNDGDA